MTASPIWVDSSLTAELSMGEIYRHDLAGFDTEFYGCDITEESPVGRAKCFTFQIAVPSGPLNPRGHNEATSYVFAGHLLREPCVKEWIEDARVTKCVHNQAVDAHCVRNSGATLRGGVNTLDMARFWYPERANRQGFDLDSLGRDLCGSGKTEEFNALLGYDATEYRDVERVKRRCACGELGCMKKKAPHDVKTEETVIVAQGYKVRRHIPLTDLSPSHRLWARFLNYAAWDAVLALWVYQIMLRDGRRERPFPWA